MTTRRAFLTEAARFASGVALGAHPLRALPLLRTTWRTTPGACVPEPTDAGALAVLATQALDAARQAGASFADIRIGEQRQFYINAQSRQPMVGWSVGYGIRVLVDGAWGFLHGEVLTTDAVTISAREAVATARGYAAVNTRVGARAVELAPAPGVTGTWTSPVAIAPFDVPIDDHLRVLLALERTTDSLYDVGTWSECTWEAATRVVASSEGTLVTQHLTRARPVIGVSSDLEHHLHIGQRVPGVIPTAAGFEALLVPDIPDRIRATAEAVMRLADLPQRTFEAEGRFPVVLDGEAMGSLLGLTLGQALDGDRVVGFEADAAGPSLLAAVDVLDGTESQFSPLVTVTADRALPGYTAVQWDDEGVAPRRSTLIEQGHLRGYLTTRETAPLIRAGASSVGCAVAPHPAQLAMTGGAHLMLAPAVTKVTLDALLRDVSHGVLCYGGTAWLDPGLSTGLFGDGMMLEVRHGQAVAHVRNVSLQLQTRRWWKDRLHALGDASTRATTIVRTQKGMPWQEVVQVATAPAALCTDVDVVRLDIKPI